MPLPLPKNVLILFGIILFFAETLWRMPILFYSLNILPYATKTFSRCKKFLILLVLKVSEWRIFIRVVGGGGGSAILRNREAQNDEKRGMSVR